MIAFELELKGQNRLNYSRIERFILMLLYAAGGKLRGRLWLHKEMFVLSRALKELELELDFEPYRYGPYSEGLDDYLYGLNNSGLVELKKDGRREIIELTKKGGEIARKLWEGADVSEKELVNGVVFLENLEWDELLLYMYVNYPAMVQKSDVGEEILEKGRRLEIALRMLGEGKVSVGLAAKLAGLPFGEFIDEAVKHGLKPFDSEGDADENWEMRCT